jgi:hypothetical protein
MLSGLLLAGLQEQSATPAEIREIALYEKNIEPCRADFSCWFHTPGVCIIKDDAKEIYETMRQSDLCLWSVPLYCFGLPSKIVTLFERILPWVSPEIVRDADGRVSHPGLGSGCRHILVMSGALPAVEDNFTSAVSRFRRMFGNDVPCICCGESSLFLYHKSEAITKLTDDYRLRMQEAGRVLGETGQIPESVQEELSKPIMPVEEYIEFTNNRCRPFVERRKKRG